VEEERRGIGLGYLPLRLKSKQMDGATAVRLQAILTDAWQDWID